TAAGFGGTWVAAPWATQDIAPLTVAFVRFTLAAVLLLGWTRIRGASLALERRDLPIVLGVALTSVIGYNVLFLYGVTLAPANHGAILVPGLIPLATLALSRFLLGATVVRRQVAGIGLSLVGLALVVGPALTGSETVLEGDVLFIVSAGVWASYTLIGRASRLDSAVLTFWGVAIGAAGLLPLALIVGGAGAHLDQLGAAPQRALLSVAYLGSIGTVLSFVTFLEGVKLIGPQRATAYSVLIPVFGLVLVAIFLNEPLTAVSLVGAVIVLAGLRVTQTAAAATASAATPRDEPEHSTPEPA
ncbi:MAG TPA: DMT family transporter, partial [Candidatus Limnocylindrales bacterium]